ncbi:Pyruvate kinase [Blastocladiella emersonii ATCC 22665]|nr:Pyruvate kinase [Blastocladiella emersonii ATCC 22665]
MDSQGPTPLSPSLAPVPGPLSPPLKPAPASYTTTLQLFPYLTQPQRNPVSAPAMADFMINSKLEWVSKMDIAIDPVAVRKTSIVATIGPNTNSVEMMCKLRKAGMNIVRLNFSHGSHEYHASVIKNARDSFESLPGRPVAIALDTKGPEIRTGLVKDDGKVTYKVGQVITITNADAYKEAVDESTLYVDYPSLTKSLVPGRHIYVEDGNITFEVLEIVDAHSLKAKALNTHTLTSRKNVNLPGTDVDLPAVSAKDKLDLQFAVEQDLDMVFASFIRRAEDVREIRRVLGPNGKHIKIISKIENLQGVRNFDEILAETDGVMVARGDLGMEIPLEKVFVAQKMMIAKCNIMGKPVICATQMLESMTSNPRPTRAEASDVANAVLDGADCVMLSGETAKGAYPIEAVETMHRICREAESVVCHPPTFLELRSLSRKPWSNTETIAASAVMGTQEQDIAAIFVLTTSGDSARLLSKYRPKVPIIAVTRNERAARAIHLYRGCYPMVVDDVPKVTVSDPKDLVKWQSNVDTRIRWAVERAVHMGLIPSQCTFMAIQGWRGGSGKTNTLRVLDTSILDILPEPESGDHHQISHKVVSDPNVEAELDAHPKPAGPEHHLHLPFHHHICVDAAAEFHDI